MQYLEAIIKETLRIFPAVPFFSRKTIEPFKIGKIIVFVLIYLLLVH